ncbi:MULTISPECIES: Ldh family oxidoreductase [unclassified Roseovarius]|uniref:Ldh family oxidoreductase n=1 Tax=unclassified Roseovarius TaxID=2614913 RepID=UPI00273DBC27|nr:Ldh family oxidoreductase [Roseovarius sp. MMSF_3350]
MLTEFMRDALVRSGADPRDAGCVADNLIWNDLVDRRNHGCERLSILCSKVRSGAIRSPSLMQFKQLGSGVGSLDAGDGFGQIAGQRAMKHAIDLASAAGIGGVSVSGSNFFGTGAAFLVQAAKADMIALVMSNSFAKVAAHGGVTPVLGTNPIAFGAPRRNGRALLVDMSTAGLAGSTLRAHRRQGLDLPTGLVIDDAGDPVTDPALALKGTLLPAAGAKGFGLSLCVEVLAGVLSGSAMSKQVGSLYADAPQAGNSGHFVLAFDIKHWMPVDAYYDRFDTMAAMIASSNPDGSVRLPGEARWDAFDRNSREGIEIEPETARRLEELAANLDMQPPW